MTTGVDTRALETRVKRMYELVATEPGAGFHFELGRKDAVFTEAARVLRPAVADIVSEPPLPESVVGNAAAARDRHRDAGANYGVRSVSVLATKPRR
ncbi:hypothetical protein [Amycolatopsis tucumanensis]|uniref:Uncharacterized protein n=1 Tax=Amycolatopsis tucumanensis TaxID=401106 RepID=A0ABP7JCI0_9PSEU|nr:hypothetical protein [Amycolatopsis tucumanensis]MCF6427153.1 hypothetical protein [Amycolatopsis tucumanensis]